MNLLKTALATTLVALLAACGNTKPTESTIEGLLEDALSQQLLIEGVVDIKDLEIVNGFEKEDGQYQAHIKYKGEFQKSFREIKKIVNTGSHNVTEQMSAGMLLTVMEMNYGEFETGLSIDSENTYTFQKGDNGWMILE